MYLVFHLPLCLTIHSCPCPLVGFIGSPLLLTLCSLRPICHICSLKMSRCLKDHDRAGAMGCPSAAAMLELSTPLCQLVTLDAGGVRGGVCRREGGGGGLGCDCYCCHSPLIMSSCLKDQDKGGVSKVSNWSCRPCPVVSEDAMGEGGV